MTAAARPAQLAEAHEDAELALLGLILLCNRFDVGALLAEVRPLVRPDDVETSEVRACLQGVYALSDAGEPINSLSVREKAAVLCPGGDVYGCISAALNASEHAPLEDAVSIARQLRQASDARMLSATLMREVRALSSGKVAPSVVAARLAEAALSVETPDQQGFQPLPLVLTETMRGLEERAAHGGMGPRDVPTGFPETDRRFGGLRPHRLYIVAGVPGSGKTAVGAQIALNAMWRAKPVGFVTAEMAATEIAERLHCNVAEIETEVLETMRLDPGQRRRLAEAKGRLDALPLEIDDAADPDVRDVVARCRALKAKVPSLAMIVVDYLQLLTGEGGDGRAEHIRDVSYKLKGMAKRIGVPVVALAQVNDKEVEKRAGCRPSLNDLQGSSGMRQAANGIGLVYRPSMYQPRGPDEPEVIELNWAKNRNGPTFTDYLRAELQYMRVGPVWAPEAPRSPVQLGLNSDRGYN